LKKIARELENLGMLILANGLAIPFIRVKASTLDMILSKILIMKTLLNEEIKKQLEEVKFLTRLLEQSQIWKYQRLRKQSLIKSNFSGKL